MDPGYIDALKYFKPNVVISSLILSSSRLRPPNPRVFLDGSNRVHAGESCAGSENFTQTGGARAEAAPRAQRGHALRRTAVPGTRLVIVFNFFLLTSIQCRGIYIS